MTTSVTTVGWLPVGGYLGLVPAIDVLNGPLVRQRRSHDLVIVIPGIMGSRLETADGTIWGLRRAVRAGLPWRRGQSLAPLAVAEDERDGRSTRVKPHGLLGFAFWVPVFGGFEPYGDLFRRLRRHSVSDAAVVAFGYDWRLPVEVNAARLATTMDQELTKWRADPDQQAAALLNPDDRPAQIVLVAHSMGGLLAYGLRRIPGALDEVRAVVTLGTPFHGSVRALELISHGAGGPPPLSHRALRTVGRTMPGLYDLLPKLPCRFTDDRLESVDPSTIAQIGGQEDLTGLCPSPPSRVGGG